MFLRSNNLHAAVGRQIAPYCNARAKFLQDACNTSASHPSLELGKADCATDVQVADNSVICIVNKLKLFWLLC